jgi:EVE domain-containing protein
MSNESATGYWIIVGSPENFAKTRELGFTMQGMKSRHGKKAEAMKPGDKIVYYITGRKAFAGISTITSPYFEGHEPIWKSKDPKKDAEDYPFRVHIEPDSILDDDEFVPAEELARQMEYASKWPAENWTLAFQGNVHKIGERDFELIQTALSEKSATVGSSV